jgi:spore coat polysaccharide biosynthesis protein SpsF (cytidylyltransferase family)
MIGCIIQARMGSSRLPGKVLMKTDEDKPLLFYVIKQLQYSKKFKKIIVATTTNKEDDTIEECVKALGVECFRGNEKDVLDRYYQCAKKFSLSVIIRITADCPLIDPIITDKVIEKFFSSNFDYATNTLVRTFPDGMDVEVFSFDALEKAWKNAILPSEREHVTPFIRNKKMDYKLINIENSKNLGNIRITVDRKQDYELVNKIIYKIKKRPILLNDVLKLFTKEPQLKDINKKYHTK